MFLPFLILSLKDVDGLSVLYLRLFKIKSVSKLPQLFVL